MFGVPWIAIKIGLYVLGVVAIFAAYASWRAHIYNEGWNAADAMWQEKALEAKIEKLEREKKAAEAAEAEAEAKAAELDALNDKLEQENKDYEEKIKTRGDKCPATDDDINELRRKKSDNGRLRYGPAWLAAAVRAEAQAGSQGWRRHAGHREEGKFGSQSLPRTTHWRQRLVSHAPQGACLG